MAKKKPCNCNDGQKEFIYYQVKASNAMGVTHCAQENAAKGIRTYIQVVPDDNLQITASDINKAAEYIEKYGLGKVAIMGGVPPCIPLPGRPCK